MWLRKIDHPAIFRSSHTSDLFPLVCLIHNVLVVMTTAMVARGERQSMEKFHLICFVTDLINIKRSSVHIIFARTMHCCWQNYNPHLTMERSSRLLRCTWNSQQFAGAPSINTLSKQLFIDNCFPSTCFPSTPQACSHRLTILCLCGHRYLQYSNFLVQ